MEERARAFVGAQEWIFAKTMADIPHFYCLKKKCSDPMEFDWFVHFLTANSVPGHIETITSVGYGDITPQTVNEKAITIVLIFVGVFVFSTITAVFSSFFTDRLIDDEKIEEELRDVKRDLALMQSQNDELKRDLDVLKTQNEDLIAEIGELKELVKK